MDQDTRNKLQRATQQVRRILEEEFAGQLEGTFDVLPDGAILPEPGKHLDARQRLTRQKLVQAIEHIESGGKTTRDAIEEYLRQAAFTILNRFVALRMLEARELLQQCVSKGDNSSGFKEFCGLASGLSALPDDGYRLYLECLCDELTVEIKVLFDRRDPTTLLWPRRSALTTMLDVLAQPELASVWTEDETIGWVYQYFNGDEERTKMRAESQAPRNSRELAVRNQFFTPRYVVQFLTDNTLGRTWYEMMQGDTQLAHLDYLVRRPNEVFLAEGESAPESDNDESELSQEELLQQMVHVPFRAKKDPRDLRILDPACGSGHFLLYTFDLLITIYEEAWDDEGAAAFTESETKLRADYGSIEEIRRAMPELILRHNLYGIDIDPRAAQIAALALWMRAQRAYNQFEVDRAHRPPIIKTNIVVAEPMPGDAELVEEFAASLKPAVLGDLFKKMVEEMKLAGELGSLLKIDESIAKAVQDAEEKHLKEGLFAERIEWRDFWGTADEKIIVALTKFSESAAGAGGVRRQLFAGDAAQGVAFIELMRKQFDVGLMNPPFGLSTKSSKLQIQKGYAEAWKDLYACFEERLVRLCRDRRGWVGAITPNVWQYSRQLRKTRAGLIRRLSCFVELGLGVMDDATVESCVWVERATGHHSEPIAVLDLTAHAVDDRTELMSSPRSDWRYVLPTSFGVISEEPFCYHLESETLSQWSRSEGRFGEHLATIAKGNTTFDDFRFVRTWWEVPFGSIPKTWTTYRTGGKFAPYCATPKLVINWAEEGKEVRCFGAARHGSDAQVMQSSRLWFKPGLYYPRVGTAGFGVRIANAGECFSGTSIFIDLRDDDLLYPLLAVLNTPVARTLMTAHGRNRLTETIAIKDLPITEASFSSHLSQLGACGRAGWTAVAKCEAIDATSRMFEGPTAPESPDAFEQWLDLVLREISSVTRAADATTRQALDIRDTEDEGPDAEKWAPNYSYDELAVRAIESALGAALGRYPLKPARVFGSAIPVIAPSDPIPIFESLADHSLSGVLVDDSGGTNDVVSQLRSALEAIWCESYSSMLNELLAKKLRVSFRSWVSTELFTAHIKHFTTNRRTAPIYWQLATPSASYSVWCYYHRLTRDTFFHVGNHYVAPKVDHEERKLNVLRQEAGPEPSSKQQEEIEVQEKFVTELAAMFEEVERIAPLWNPNLNDGVIINFAPLWRLVPQNKSWQEECKKVWGKLVKGEYDWAHLAMHLWPERVVPKCVTDASLAIAHGLEEVFWEQDDRDRFQPKEEPEGGWEPVINQLVDERTSPAVMAALESLLTAPAPATKSTRRKKAKAS